LQNNEKCKSPYNDIYYTLHQAYGPQYWWPAETDFEIMVGAILTQNTSWTNVELAITNIKKARVMNVEGMIALNSEALASLIRPAGFFNIKTLRLQSMCRFLLTEGGMDELANHTTDRLRTQLLGVHGIGPETADSILLYAFGRNIFVIDAYTKRIFQRLGLLAPGASYNEAQQQFHAQLPCQTSLFNQYHALIVEHAKRHCRVKPSCPACPVRTFCPTGNSNSA